MDNDKKMLGEKFSKGKPPVGRFLKQFPEAIKLLSEVSAYGHNKYIKTDELWDNWKNIPDAETELFDAAARHFIEDGYDDESGLPHFAHFVWNAIAVLQLKLEKKSGPSAHEETFTRWKNIEHPMTKAKMD